MLLYIAHFSFDDIAASTSSAEDGARHGYFALVVEASDVEEAVDKFKALIIVNGHLRIPFLGHEKSHEKGDGSTSKSFASAPASCMHLYRGVCYVCAFLLPSTQAQVADAVIGGTRRWRIR